MSVLEETTINVTANATEVVRKLLTDKNVPDYGLRVFVSGGGCSGMQYGMALEAEARPYDHVVENDGVKIFIDPTSMMYLNGATVDYEDSIMGGGFKSTILMQRLHVVAALLSKRKMVKKQPLAVALLVAVAAVNSR